MLSPTSRRRVEANLRDLGLPAEFVAVTDQDLKASEQRVREYIAHGVPHPSPVMGPPRPSPRQEESPHPRQQDISHKSADRTATHHDTNKPKGVRPRYMSDRHSFKEAQKINLEKARERHAEEEAESAAHAAALERRQLAYERALAHRKKELQELKPALAKPASYATAFSARSALFNVARTPTTTQVPPTSDAELRPRLERERGPRVDVPPPREWMYYDRTGVSKKKER